MADIHSGEPPPIYLPDAILAPVAAHGAPIAAVAVAMSELGLCAEVAALDPLISSANFEVYLTTADQSPRVLNELGRLREITFREAGAGTGKQLDIDPFDRYYLHLFPQNSRRREIVGASHDADRHQHGRRIVYRRSVLLEALGPALELGRSFIRPEYQRAFAPLLLLWRGIGRFITSHRRYKVLFGAVSISNRYSPVSRELIISFLKARALATVSHRLLKGRDDRRHADKAALRPSFPESFDIDDLSSMIADIEENQAGVPVLHRHYLKLGGQLLGFHVDRAFVNVLNALIRVDLTQTAPKILERYLGRKEAAAFLEHHQLPFTWFKPGEPTAG